MAARAQGVPTRFSIGRRLYFLVFETDLSQLWGLPRRRRFAPLLAGLAYDTVILSALLAMQLISTDSFVDRLAAAAGYFVAFFLPAIWTLLGWITESLSTAAPTTGRFWQSVVFAILALAPLALLIGVTARDRLHRKTR